MEFWYENQNFDKLKSKFVIQDLKNEEMPALQTLQIQWISQHKIETTPSIFINEYQVPSLYQIKDLENHISRMVNYFSNKNIVSV